MYLYVTVRYKAMSGLCRQIPLSGYGGTSDVFVEGQPRGGGGSGRGCGGTEEGGHSSVRVGALAVSEHVISHFNVYNRGARAAYVHAVAYQGRSSAHQGRLPAPQCRPLFQLLFVFVFLSKLKC